MEDVRRLSVLAMARRVLYWRSQGDLHAMNAALDGLQLVVSEQMEKNAADYRVKRARSALRRAA